MSFARAGSKPPPIPAGMTPSPPRVPKTADGRPRVVFRDAAAPPSAPSVNKTTRPGSQGAPAGPDGSRIVDHYALTQHVHTSTATNTEVHAARNRITGELVTMKAVDRAQLATAGRVPMSHSTPLYAQLEHEHICRLHEVFDSQRMVLVLEWIPGITLEEFMLSHGCGADEAQEIMRQLASAVAYMHSAGVCHRDIRLTNVMLRTGTRCCVKLIDLGAVGPSEKLLSRRTPVVPVYAAPELLPPPTARGAAAPPLPEYSGKAVDVWAMGVLLHVLLCGKYPFLSEAECREAKVEKNEHIPEEAYSLLKGMLTVDRAERLSANDVVNHPWLAAKGGLQADDVIASGSPAAWLRSARALALKGENIEQGADGAEAAAHEAVLTELEGLGMARKAVVAALEANAHDEYTTAYCLLWQKRARTAHIAANRIDEADMAPPPDQQPVGAEDDEDEPPLSPAFDDKGPEQAVEPAETTEPEGQAAAGDAEEGSAAGSAEADAAADAAATPEDAAANADA